MGDGSKGESGGGIERRAEMGMSYGTWVVG